MGSRDVEKRRKRGRRRLPVVPVKPWPREDLADLSVCVIRAIFDTHSGDLLGVAYRAPSTT
jgi:hypothetical protein